MPLLRRERHATSDSPGVGVGGSGRLLAALRERHPLMRHCRSARVCAFGLEGCVTATTLGFMSDGVTVRSTDSRSILEART